MTAETLTASPRILVVEDDVSYSNRLARNLDLDGFETECVLDVEGALEALEAQTFDLVLADLRMPGRGGLELLDAIHERAGEGDALAPPVVILTSVGDVETVVDAMRRGAADYLTKEATREEIALRVRKSLRTGRLAHEVRRLRRSIDRFQDFDEIIGASAAIAKVKADVIEIAPSTVHALITGETGVGKELVARAIHRASDRAAGPFVEVNCAALPDENMFLSELFGHERGAFTGAIARKRGQFELAEGGTLFLDEVGELGRAAQARLLRAVETLEFTRVGGERPIRCNCRLVFATNKNLEEEIEAKRFRSDLYHRINVFRIHVPPLRARIEDLPALCEFLTVRCADRHHMKPVAFAPEAITALQTNAWPGNVRELRNVIERCSIRLAGRTVQAADLRELDLTGDGAQAGAVVLPRGGINLDDAEKCLVLQALERCEFSQRKASALLGISVDRMNARVKKFGISHPSWRVHKGA